LRVFSERATGWPFACAPWHCDQRILTRSELT
jgi:hypothetical protein